MGNLWSRLLLRWRGNDAPNVPVPNVPVPSVPAPNAPAPNVPAPNVPVPNVPVPSVPAPNAPAPSVPAPNAPAPNVPAPNAPVSAPNVPAPNARVPAPNVPAPNVPASNVPAPNIPASNVPAPNVPDAGSANAADKIYVALYDYEARTPTDLTFKKGDKMELIWIIPFENQWCAMRLINQDHMTSNMEGYVPSNYIVKLGSLESQPWYVGKLERFEVIRLLKQQHNPNGTFMIRESTSKPNEYALSVLHENVCRHYLICRINDGGRDKLHIKRNFQTLAFLTLNELVAYYQSTDDIAICTRLTAPCIEDENPQTDGLSHELADKLEVDRTEFKLGEKLGEGYFGQVYEGLWNGTTKVAVKTVKQGTMEEERLLKEAKLMKKLRHPKLIQLYAVCTRSQPFYIVTELMCNGSLLSYLKENDLNQSILIDMATQIASGMAYLETNNYIHRGLAARNILVGKNNCVKIADSGLAMALKEEMYESGGTQFPVRWSAPESVLQHTFTIKSDVWSYGILLAEIFGKGTEPYEGWSNREVLEQVERGYRMPQLPDCPDSLYAIMLNCWNADPKKRDSFETLLCKLEVTDSIYFDA